MKIVKGNVQSAVLRLQGDKSESDYYDCKNSIENWRLEIMQ